MQRVNPQDPWWANWFAQNGVEQENFHPIGGVQLASQAATGQAALAGQGLALLTPALWNSELAEGRLVRSFEHHASEGNAYWLVCLPARRRARKIARFGDWIASALGTSPKGSRDLEIRATKRERSDEGWRAGHD